jgi:8-oxo-dGTP pyrophosphatase MutT (NUDIX family)
VGLFRRLAGIVPSYVGIAWWGFVTPRTSELEPLVIVQAVVRDGDRVLLTTRTDLLGWELPGGNVDTGERAEDAVRREVLEETGLEVAVERHVGDYVRTGFRPHTARVYRCRVLSGAIRPSDETPQVDWFPLERLPQTLFPWYLGPIADGRSASGGSVTRNERHGLREIWAGMKIDLRMRLNHHAR